MTLSREAQRKRLDNVIGPYLRQGWVVTSQTDTRAQLTYQRRRGCLSKALGGFILDWLFPKRGKVLNFEITPKGKLRKWERKRHL